MVDAAKQGELLDVVLGVASLLGDVRSIEVVRDVASCTMGPARKKSCSVSLLVTVRLLPVNCQVDSIFLVVFLNLAKRIGLLRRHEVVVCYMVFVPSYSLSG